MKTVQAAVYNSRELSAVRTMYASISLARFFAFAALVGSVYARVQPNNAEIYVDVAPHSEEQEEIEKRYTKELVEEFNSVSADALLLFTEYTAKAGAELKTFLRNMSLLTADTIGSMDPRVLDNAPASCRVKFESQLKKIEYDAHRAASFNGENHHKFLLGHMIVFRMHLNKSEEYIKKCDRIIKDCGIPCETTPRITKWRRLALEEINRVRDDIEHSRRSYRDLLLHAHRRLNHLRKHAKTRASAAVQELTECVQAG
ncbi:unnamed protein product [Parnassius mnemosyne]|uniref:Uncharacterized protein n=2 Tax=Parnassius mnemosyne TaxID=213953 RepID=A0AAV1KB60_9NEOP